MTDVVEQRVTDIVNREAESLSGDRRLCAKIQFATSYLWAQYTPNEKWQLVSSAEDDSALRLKSEEIKQVHLCVPGPLETNCWGTVFYLLGLAEHEGGQDERPDVFVQRQVAAGKLTRVNSIDEANFVANGSSALPTSIIHAALPVDRELVCDYLTTLARVKGSCANQLGFPMMPERVATDGARVLIERFGASVRGGFGNDSIFNFAIELGELRDFPMFYALAGK